MHGTEALFDVLSLLLAAVILVPLCRRFGIPSVLAYLSAGVLLGPYTPGPVVDLEVTRVLAEFGVVFLLFAIGMELPLSRLRTMRRYILGLGFAQVAVTAALIGGIAVGLGLGARPALVAGLTLAFSSTAAVLAILVERGEAVSHYGRIAVAVLIFQDLAVVPVLVLLPLLAGDGLHMGEALALAGLKAALVLGAILGVGRLLLRPAYRFIAQARSPEVFTAANLLLVLAVAWATAEAGMSMALGAFLAGLLLADSRYRHQVEADIEPFRGLLLGLFFMTVGMSIDLPFVAAHLSQVVGLAVGTALLKAAVLALLCRPMGVERSDGMRVALLLAQGGEFAFVVFGRAAELGVMAGPIAQTLTAAVALSMVLTPILAAVGRALAARSGTRQESPIPQEARDTDGHVIIVGYGRVGRTVGRLLTEHGIPFLGLDSDAERVAKARGDGLPVYFGDAGRGAVLRSVGIQGARAAVVTVNAGHEAERAIAAMRAEAPRLPVIARARDRLQERELADIGAVSVIPETVEASLQMAGAVLRSAGIAEDKVEGSLRAYRSARYGRLGF